MRTIANELAEHPFFEGLDDDTMTLLAGCARNVHVNTDAYLLHEGDAADDFFVVRRGRVALEVADPAGSPHVLDTVEAGEVLGWSWIIPPYRWFVDARAVEPSSVICLDGACLRGKCEADPALGYMLMKRVAQVMYQRLTAARMRMIDVYGERRGSRR